MSYAEAKSKNFAKYCKEGKLHLVKKWIDNPNVDINWNKHSPLRYSVKTGQIESIKLLLAHPKLRTDYENDKRELKGTMQVDGDKYVAVVFNPFTEAMVRKNFEILDLFLNGSHDKKFKLDRTENLDVLLEMNDEELTEYFRNIPGFIDFIMKSGDKYLPLISEDVNKIFLF